MITWAWSFLTSDLMKAVRGKKHPSKAKNGMKELINFLRVPELHEHRKCTGFTYCGAKIFNSLPIKIRETQDSIIFKELVKNWIWDEIPSY